MGWAPKGEGVGAFIQVNFDKPVELAKVPPTVSPLSHVRVVSPSALTARMLMHSSNGNTGSGRPPPS